MSKFHMVKLIVVVVLALGGTAIAHAVERSVAGTVDRTLVADNDRWGGCMIQLSTDLGPGCPSKWASFSCSGVYTTKDIAYRMFDTAVAAFALNKSVRLWLDDAKKHNGMCYANRIDIIPTP